MSKKKVKDDKFRAALAAVVAETTQVRHNSTTIEIKGFLGPEIAIHMDFDDADHLRKKLVKMLNTKAFGELLTLHCEGEILGGIDISIGANMHHCQLV